MSIVSPTRVQVRLAREQDLPDLLTLEQRSFELDGLSRRSFRRFMSGSASVLLVAVHQRTFAGYILVLFRPRCPIARLYSMAVSPQAPSCVVNELIAAAEGAARRRRCKVMRFDIPERSAGIAAHCRKSGFDVIPVPVNKLGTLQLEKPLYAAAQVA